MTATGSEVGSCTGTSTRIALDLERVKKKKEQKKKELKKKPPSLRHLIYTRKWDECIRVAKLYPTQAELKDRMGDLPLHEACNSGAPFQLVQVLYKSYSAAIQEQGFCGRLPLHYASYSKPSLHTIKFLLRHYPEGAEKFDADGRLPLHLAVIRNAPKQAIQALIAAYPRSLMLPNHYGNTPDMLARNEHVYELLMQEKEVPRGINTKLDIEKKLMRGWYDGSKSPVDGTESPTSERSHKNMSPISEKSHESKTLTSEKSSDDTVHQKKKKESPSPAPKVSKKTSSTINNRSADKAIAIAKASPTKHKEKINSYGAAATTPKILSPRGRGRALYSADTQSTRSRSTDSERSRSTIQGTNDDMAFMEHTSKSTQYKATKRTSPRSTLDYSNYHLGRMGRPKRKEIMSTKNGRRILPSPTRMRMVVHPVWK